MDFPEGTVPGEMRDGSPLVGITRGDALDIQRARCVRALKHCIECLEGTEEPEGDQSPLAEAITHLTALMAVAAQASLEFRVTDQRTGAVIFGGKVDFLPLHG